MQWERVNRRQHPLRVRLSALGREGFGYAAEIAGAARARSFAAIGREHAEYDDDVTATVLARESYDQVSATTVRRRVQQAREELFGVRSDRSIRRVLSGIETDAVSGTARSCGTDGCETPLPAGATSRRRYCEWHAQPWAKAERYRAKRRTSDE